MSNIFSRRFTQMNADQICVYARKSAAKLLLSRARTPAGDIDWEYLFQLARRHSIVPLVYVQLDHGPPEVLAKFKQHYIENSARNTVLAAELCRLINLFSNAGIDAIPYKGPALALFAYGNIALRRFVDLDVIVKKADVAKACEILLNEGYTPSKSLSPAQQELLLRTQHNIQFSRDNHRLLLELHWEVAPHLFASTVNGERLWQDLITLDLNGTPVKTFSAEDLLFALCVHGSRHLWERLGWICDVAELLTRHTLDWTPLLPAACFSSACISPNDFSTRLYRTKSSSAALQIRVSSHSPRPSSNISSTVQRTCPQHRGRSLNTISACEKRSAPALVICFTCCVQPTAISPPTHCPRA